MSDVVAAPSSCSAPPTAGAFGLYLCNFIVAQSKSEPLGSFLQFDSRQQVTADYSSEASLRKARLCGLFSPTENSGRRGIAPQPPKAAEMDALREKLIIVIPP